MLRWGRTDFHGYAMKKPAVIILASALTSFSAPGILLPADCTGVTPTTSTTFTTVPLATGFTGRPLFVTSPPGDRDRLFVLEQNGLIWFHRRGDAVGVKTLFLDISTRVQAAPSNNEMGL